MAVTRRLSVDAREPDVATIREAAEVLCTGGLVAFPTETVYGLGAHALDATAVARIFEAKGRPPTDPLIVHVASVDQLPLIARDVPPLAMTLAAAFWPGPLTMLLARQEAVPPSVTAGLQTVGVRVPSHPVAQALLRAAGLPVAAPSANQFSRPSPTTAAHVLADLDGRIDVVIDGGATVIGVESTIIDLTVTPPLIRRHGGITREAIARIVPDVQAATHALGADTAQPAPGQLLRHYAPRATTTLYQGEVDALSPRVASEIRRAVASGLRVGVLAPEEDLRALAPRLAAIGSGGRVVTRRCGSRADREEAARMLYGALRELDAAGVDVILAVTPEPSGIDAAITDRLTRAAEGRVIHL
jgi:L-threonylcarbamoyladenylate synthase